MLIRYKEEKWQTQLTRLQLQYLNIQIFLWRLGYAKCLVWSHFKGETSRNVPFLHVKLPFWVQNGRLWAFWKSSKLKMEILGVCNILVSNLNPYPKHPILSLFFSLETGVLQCSKQDTSQSFVGFWTWFCIFILEDLAGISILCCACSVRIKINNF